MNESPWFTIAAAAVAAYLFSLWWNDYRTVRESRAKAGALPGAAPVSKCWTMVGIIGALVLVGIESTGEYALGVVGEQSTVTVLALLGFLAAGFYEELIFRGFIFYDRGGRRCLILSILGASLLFALLHYQYYLAFPDTGGWQLNLGAKSGWTLLLLFLNSLWFYYLRFSRHNAQRSLLPCFLAHMASNAAVFGVKAAQGFVSGWW